MRLTHSQWEKEIPSGLGEDRRTNVLITAVNIIPI